jgi:hypothetical protein
MDLLDLLGGDVGSSAPAMQPAARPNAGGGDLLDLLGGGAGMVFFPRRSDEKRVFGLLLALFPSQWNSRSWS